MNFCIQSPRGQTDRQGVQKEFVVPVSHYLIEDDHLAFFNDNFSIVFIEKNVISDFNIENISRSFDNLNTSSTCNFSAPKKFHKTHHINGITEILKYLINDVHYIDDLMEFININGGMRDERYEREPNN